ncbi:MAG: saccharopine dehydrogenase NADP-binding domain-containing protein, partial [Azoarcus sp.]|nr:saccharopine dehydrogenase NADP-binding domain-containing protein [Azoarcus sp.]
MKQILIVGAGKIGTVIADLLSACGDYEVTVADRDGDALDRLVAALPALTVETLD